MIRLRNIISSIKYGPHFRTENQGDVKYLKGNHFDDDFQFSLFSESYVNISQKDKQYLLTENDIIIAAKGFRNFAWKYTSDKGACIASSLFYVVKLKEDSVHPDYFTMAINSPRIQHRLTQVGLGATIPAIPKKELLRIKIAVPSIEEQMNAIEIYKTINRQIQLEREILEKRIMIKNRLLNRLTNTE